MTRIPIGAARPTVLYLDAAALADAIATFDFEDPGYDPLPAFRHRDGTYLAGGHAVAFAAHLGGENGIEVDTDAAFGTDEMRLYRQRVNWCWEAGVESVADLAGRVVSPETYEEEWVERCRRTADRLAGE